MGLEQIEQNKRDFSKKKILVEVSFIDLIYSIKGNLKRFNMLKKVFFGMFVLLTQMVALTDASASSRALACSSVLYQSSMDSFLLYLARKSSVEKIVAGACVHWGDKVLVLKRSADDFMGGIHEIPSGGLDAGEPISLAATRELKEETNLDAISVQAYLGSFDYRSKSGRLTRQYNFLIDVTDVSTLKLNPKEHSEFRWTKEEEVEGLVTPSVAGIIRNSFAYISRRPLSEFDFTVDLK
jgi:8-oxo-dGTP diphosphatase